MFGELAEEEKARWVRIVVAAVLAGTIIFLAQDMTQWLLGIDMDNPGNSLPQSLVDIVKKLFGVARYIGGVVVIIGLVAGVIKL